jgi:transcriptional regulator with XRE-family HTH domain
MEFYKVLQEMLNEKGLTIPEAARICGLSDSTIRTILVRKNKSVSLDVAFKLATGLGVSIDKLNYGSNETNTSSGALNLVEDKSDNKKTVPENEDKLSPLDSQLVDLLRFLTDDQKKLLLAQIKILKESQ